MPGYSGPDSPPTPNVIVNYLDADGRLINMGRMSFDYLNTGRVELVSGGPFPKFNIYLDAKGS